MIQLRRNSLNGFNSQTQHAGLFLARGMDNWPEGNSGEAKANHISNTCNINYTKGYELAFNRWKNTISTTDRFTSFEAPLIHRMYIGVNRDNPTETGVTVSHTWGMPIIPGSSLKGLARNCAKLWLNNSGDDSKNKIDEINTFIFGTDYNEYCDDDHLESGGLIFHDAWWVPSNETKPFVEEVITPHHTGYYNEGSAPASDFDSPIPAPQIAVTGSFYFVIEGDPEWSAFAKQLLLKGLQNIGAGAKRSSGYGFFN